MGAAIPARPERGRNWGGLPRDAVGKPRDMGDQTMRNFLVLLASAGFASAGAWAATSAAPPNYDAAAVALDRAAHSDDHRFARLNVKLHQALSASHPLKSRHYPSSYDARLGTATFLWAPPALRPQSASRALAYSPVQPAQRAETAARA